MIVKMVSVNFKEDSEYKRLFDDDEDSEEFIESVYNQEMKENFEKVEDGVGIANYE